MQLIVGRERFVLWFEMQLVGLWGFFFSSRRRHTRWTGDWSSVVCSSDLVEELGDDRRVHRRAAGGHTAYSVEKVVDLDNTVLEEISEAGRAVAEQVHGGGRLDVLGQQHGSGLRPGRPDGANCFDAIVQMVRWHTDVGDQQVGPVRVGGCD